MQRTIWKVALVAVAINAAAPAAAQNRTNYICTLTTKAYGETESYITDPIDGPAGKWHDTSMQKAFAAHLRANFDPDVDETRAYCTNRTSGAEAAKFVDHWKGEWEKRGPVTMVNWTYNGE